MRTSSDAVRSEAGNLGAAEADVTRLRLLVEGTRSFEMVGGGTLVPSAEVGVRHDGGEAETGTGLETGASLAYRAGPLSVEGRVRMLLAHEDSGYEEWGASGSVRIDPGAQGRGLSLTLAPSWGATGSGTGQLWSLGGARLADEQAFEGETRVEAEVGYGLGLRGAPGVLTPYAGATLGEAGKRTLRTGARWNVSDETTLGLEATHAGNADNALMLQARVRF